MTDTSPSAPQHVVIYTDGACKGNPGPGGWGAMLSTDGNVKELFGGELAGLGQRPFRLKTCLSEQHAGIGLGEMHVTI
jgi:hypothetical protein